jgi:NitT/TauT family transport system substrate-binding protein
MTRKLIFVMFALVLVMAVPGAAQDTPEPDLQIAVLPVLNTLPMFVAQEQGLYEKEGITVELIPFESARDQSIALQSDQVDGANTDMMVLTLLANSGTDIKAVWHDAFTSDYSFFAVVAGKDSGIVDIDGLIDALDAGDAQIAISNNTIIEYLTTAMLREAGYEPDRDTYLEISAIPVRLEQLAQGTIAAATLPEPMVTFATAIQGGTSIIDDTAIDFIPTVVVFRQATLDEKPEAVAAFLRAYANAVELINENPDDFRYTEIRVPDPVRETYTVPQFLTASVPTEEETLKVMDWMLERGMIDEVVPYERLVDDSFLPERSEEEGGTG